MSRLHRISDGGAEPRGSVVFVHGLQGHPFTTWQHNASPDSLWPRWIGEDVPDVAVYTMEYEASVSSWFGHAMALPDRASNALATLRANGLESRSVLLVCHSLGGLLAKQMLRLSRDIAADSWLVEQTRGVVFLGTPNAGSNIASLADRFRVLIRPSEATRDMVADDSHLRDLNVWYREHAARASIATQVFTEARPTKGLIVVDQTSADPGIAGVRPIPLDTDHIGVCKPASRDETVYRLVRQFIEENLSRRTGLAGAIASPRDQYDVFISHSTVQKHWVEALARNLQGANKSVFLDLWRLVPGREWKEGLRAGLASCRAAILVVSPEALESGWVREEYEVLKRRRVEEPDFPIIPVIHTDAEGARPFAGDIQWVDFRDPARHREAFAILLAGLEGRGPGPSPTYHGQWELLPRSSVPQIPDARQKLIVDQLFNRLFNSPAVILLAQASTGISAVAQEIIRRAVDRFGRDSVFHLVPSYVSPEDGSRPYFDSLLTQMGQSVAGASPDEFQRTLEARLKTGTPLCLVMTGVEHSPRSALAALCGILRALGDRHSNFRVILCGGERLCDMRYANGAMSFLSHATDIRWPDPGEAEFRALQNSLSPDSNDPAILRQAIDVAGANLALVQELLGAVVAGVSDSESLCLSLQESPTLWSAVSPLLDKSEVRAQLRDLAGKPSLGPSHPYIRDPLMRRLYWLNLIGDRAVDRKRQLVWRSAAIQEAVRQIVEDSPT